MITGGAGFIGQCLGRALLQRGKLTGPGGTPQAIDEILLFDVAAPAQRPAWADDRVTMREGDISDPALVRGLIDRDDIAVFHLASVVSGGGENATVRELIAALHRVVDSGAAGKRELGDIVFKPDPFIQRICDGSPQDVVFGRAEQLGLPKDASLDAIVENYIEDFL